MNLHDHDLFHSSKIKTFKPYFERSYNSGLNGSGKGVPYLKENNETFLDASFLERGMIGIPLSPDWSIHSMQQLCVFKLTVSLRAKEDVLLMFHLCYEGDKTPLSETMVSGGYQSETFDIDLNSLDLGEKEVQCLEVSLRSEQENKVLFSKISFSRT